MAVLFKLTKMIEAEIEDFLNEVSESALIFRKAIQSYLKDDSEDFNERLTSVTDAERKADELRLKIEKQLYLRTLIPENRGDVLAIMENTDGIIDTIKDTLMEFSVECPMITEDLDDTFLELADASMQSVEWLIKAIRAFFKEFYLVNELLSKVKFYEKEADRIAVNLKRKIFSKDIDLSCKIHMRYFAFHVERISDAAEAVADRLAIYAIKREV